MVVNYAAIVLSLIVSIFALPHPRLLRGPYSEGFTLVSRDEWNARPALSSTNLNTPVEYVIIHHSYEPEACFTKEECSRAMRSMQDFHQLSNGWMDIGYNFAVGSDGNAYEGRGWDQVGAHAVSYNTRSIGIVLIGDWRSTIPPTVQLKTTQEIIAEGVNLGYIRPDYKLVGHRQVGSTECPGDALYNEISTWDQFQTNGQDFTLVSRNEWNARPARSSVHLNTPVEYVIIHHSYQPGACFSKEACSRAMRSMQDFHQLSNGWVDIGYNFAVGSDGNAYEGRGWDKVGAHASGYNSRSIGIVLIGDWTSITPPAGQLKKTQQIIAAGVNLGFIRRDYKLVGHRQVGNTDSPGDALFKEISTWDRFQTNAEENPMITLVSRNEWNARPARSSVNLNTPVEYVIIHHSYQPGACFIKEACSRAMRSMQDFHQLSNGWVDIGYNFAVGSDGNAYEGRGWDKVGAHASGYNSRSIGIVLIGDWTSTIPPARQLKTTQQIIAAGINLGYIRPNYKLVGHRQVGSTECPGVALFREISTWDRALR